ncbi:MAG: hypothetical protein CVU34_19450 [Betaproteobacteria bacterium HGW-Betaproteobacteria-7]|jgi:hypothetical protein|nr:MAG: hypothetical protein CVU34_19450 [Betaproteobacteria bacterium HGW-Betaproteobacteria-7]
MHPRALALIVAAALAAGCVGTETKPDQPAPEKASAAPAPEPVAAAPAKPECPPEPAPSKKKSTKKTTKKEAKPLAPPDCEPAKPKTASAPPATQAAAPAAAAGVGSADSAIGKSCNPCVVKSRDGSFDGEVYGNIPAGSKWARLRIGMEQPEVEKLLGVSHNVHAYPTAKAWIPFYYGTDRTRYEVRYPGQGSVSYTGGSWGGGRGVLMMINYDTKQ